LRGGSGWLSRRQPRNEILHDLKRITSEAAICFINSLRMKKNGK
jgi:hypothetical protein